MNSRFRKLSICFSILCFVLAACGGGRFDEPDDVRIITANRSVTLEDVTCRFWSYPLNPRLPSTAECYRGDGGIVFSGEFTAIEFLDE